jgi:hypothetical protein
LAPTNYPHASSHDFILGALDVENVTRVDHHVLVLPWNIDDECAISPQPHGNTITQITLLVPKLNQLSDCPEGFSHGLPPPQFVFSRLTGTQQVINSVKDRFDDVRQDIIGLPALFSQRRCSSVVAHYGASPDIDTYSDDHNRGMLLHQNPRQFGSTDKDVVGPLNPCPGKAPLPQEHAQHVAGEQRKPGPGFLAAGSGESQRKSEGLARS